MLLPIRTLKRKIQSESKFIINTYKSRKRKQIGRKSQVSRQVSQVSCPQNATIIERRMALDCDFRSQEAIKSIEKFLETILFIPIVLIKIILQFSLLSKYAENLYLSATLITDYTSLVFGILPVKGSGNIWIPFTKFGSLYLSQGILESSPKIDFHVQLQSKILSQIGVEFGENVHVNIKDNFLYISVRHTIWILDLQESGFKPYQINLELPQQSPSSGSHICSKSLPKSWRYLVLRKI